MALASAARSFHAATSRKATTSARRTKVKFERFMSAFHLRDVLEHLVRGLDRLGIDLVGALGGDEVHHFLDDVHIGGLDVALHRAAEPLFTGLACFGRTAGGGL